MSYTFNYELSEYTRAQKADAIRPLMTSGAHLMVMNMVMEHGGSSVSKKTILKEFKEIQKSDAVHFDILRTLRELEISGFIRIDEFKGDPKIRVTPAIEAAVIHLILKAI